MYFSKLLELDHVEELADLDEEGAPLWTLCMGGAHGLRRGWKGWGVVGFHLGRGSCTPPILAQRGAWRMARARHRRDCRDFGHGTERRQIPRMKWYLFKANHGTVKHKKIAKWIVDQIAQDFPVTAFASEKEAYD